jgi:ribonuclease VapC
MGEVIVLDSSAILAAILGEAGGQKVHDLAARCVVSAVNVEEIRTRLHDLGHSREDIENYIQLFKLEIADFTNAQSVASSNLRPMTRKAGLSLGDRACLSLAIEKNATAMTADRQWASVDVPVRVEVIR